MVSICAVTSTSSQRILARNGTVVAPVDQDILKMKMDGTSGLSLEPYLWRQHSSANSSPKQRSCRALSRLRALPVLPMALLLPTRRPLLASPVAADIIIHLFVLDQVCLVAATNVLLSNALRARRVQAGQQGAGGPAGRRQEQSSCTSYVLRRKSVYKLEKISTDIARMHMDPEFW
jgi:hypothetical protein